MTGYMHTHSRVNIVSKIKRITLLEFINYKLTISTI